MWWLCDGGWGGAASFPCHIQPCDSLSEKKGPQSRTLPPGHRGPSPFSWTPPNPPEHRLTSLCVTSLRPSFPGAARLLSPGSAGPESAVGELGRRAVPPRLSLDSFVPSLCPRPLSDQLPQAGCMFLGWGKGERCWDTACPNLPL